VSVTIADTAANVSQQFDRLNAAGVVSSIALSDSGAGLRTRVNAA